MSTGEIIIIVLMVLYIFLESYLKKKAENRADKQDIQDITYLSKKGENLATKEDIQEITNLVESVKKDVAFESQRKHDYIEKRTELFLSILKYAEEIDHCGLLMNCYVYTENADEKIDSLIQRIEDITSAASYNHNIILVSDKNIQAEEDIQPLMELTRIIRLYGAELCIYGARAMQFMSRIKGYADLYAIGGKNQENFMKIAMSVRNQLNELQKEESPKTKYQKEYQEKYNNYFAYLYKLYNKDFNINYNYNQPPQ